MVVVNFLHLLDVVKPTDHVGGADDLATPNGAAMELLNQTQVASVVTPRFADGGGIDSIMQIKQRDDDGRSVDLQLLGDKIKIMLPKDDFKSHNKFKLDGTF